MRAFKWNLWALVLLSSLVLWTPKTFGAPEKNKITLENMTERDFSEMIEKVSAFEANLKLSPKEMSKRDFALTNGKMFATSRPGKEGMVEEWTEGLIPLPFEEFVKKIPPEKWGPNLADYIGGEIKPYGKDRQIERMVLKGPLQNLDMTKIEQIVKKYDSQGRLVSAKIIWEVKKSDNGSVVTDTGHVTFSRYGKKYTKVLFQSSHKLNTFPFNVVFLPKSWKDWMMGKSLSDYFTRVIKQYKKIATGEGFLDRLKKMFK